MAGGVRLVERGIAGGVRLEESGMAGGVRMEEREGWREGEIGR